jgi:hypothetical protein
MKPDTLPLIKQSLDKATSGVKKKNAKVYQYVIGRQVRESNRNYFKTLNKGENVIKPEVSADVHSGIKTFE